MFDPFAGGTSNKAAIGRAYVSPAAVAMGGIGGGATTPMSSYIPGGGFGGKSVGKGTVIPHHKPGRGGGSLGYNPHKPPHRNIIVDPHVQGRAVALDLDKVRPEDSEQAFAAGMEFAGQIMEDPPERMDDIEMKIEEGPRLGAYAAVRILADTFHARSDDTFDRLAGRGGQMLQAAPAGETFGGVKATAPVPPATTGAAKAAALGQATVGQPAPVHIVGGGPPPDGGGAGPMARFRPAPAPPRAAAQAAPVLVDRPHQAAAGPPTVKVTFDFGDQVGQFPAQYHRAIRTPGGIVLAWDTRWQYGEPYSPEHLASQFAVQIAGDPEAHLVMATGDTFTFEFDGFRFYHLGIVESMPAG